MLPQKRAGEPAPIRPRAACSRRSALQQSVQHDALHAREPAAHARILNRVNQRCDCRSCLPCFRTSIREPIQRKPAKYLLRLMRCRCQRRDRAVSALECRGRAARHREEVGRGWRLGRFCHAMFQSTPPRGKQTSVSRSGKFSRRLALDRRKEMQLVDSTRACDIEQSLLLLSQPA